MRSLPFALASLLCLTASVLPAHGRSATEAQQDGLAGPVKSVVTSRLPGQAVQWSQPAGPTLVLPVWCRACDYDQDGYRTRSGDLLDGKFVGEQISLDRDGDGHVISRHAADASTGEPTRDERLGPYGRLELDAFIRGKQIAHQLFRYDRWGHRSEWLCFDGAGNSEGRVVTVADKDGTELETSSWAGDGTLLWRHAYDPASDKDDIVVFDKAGAPALTRTFDRGNVTSFWEASDKPNRFGQSFSSDHGNGNVDLYECHRGSGCTVSRVHYEYAGPGKLNPISAEWRDSGGNLQWAAYYEYEFDAFRNWTHRTVWVVSPGQTHRTLYEEDARTIEYWK